MAANHDRMSRLLPQGPISRADLERALQGEDVLLEGGPAPLDENHLYLLVRDLHEGTTYHVVYALAEQQRWSARPRWCGTPLVSRGTRSRGAGSDQDRSADGSGRTVPGSAACVWAT
jgi:hypothetical protein